MTHSARVEAIAEARLKERVPRELLGAVRSLGTSEQSQDKIRKHDLRGGACRKVEEEKGWPTGRPTAEWPVPGRGYQRRHVEGR